MSLHSLESVRDPTPGLQVCLRSWLTDSPQCPSHVTWVKPIGTYLSGQKLWHARFDISNVHSLQNRPCDGNKVQ